MKKEYVCLKCGRTFMLDGTITDGRNCPICKGPLVLNPIELFIPSKSYKEPDVDLIDLDRVIVHDDNGKTYKIICDIHGNLHLKKISNQFLKIKKK